MQCFRSKKESK